MIQTLSELLRMNWSQSHDTSGYFLLKQTFQLKWDPDVVGKCISSLLPRWYQGNEDSTDSDFLCTYFLVLLLQAVGTQYTCPLWGAQCLAHSWSLKASPINKYNEEGPNVSD